MKNCKFLFIGFDTNNDDSHFFHDNRKFSASKNMLVLDEPTAVAREESALSPKNDKNINAKVIKSKSVDVDSSSQSDSESDGKKKKNKKKGKFNTLEYMRGGCSFLKYICNCSIF